MIGQLRGKLLEKQPPSLLIDVQGIGYLLQAPMSTFFTLPPVGEEVILRTHFIVREDAHLLFGFTTQEECRLFQEIIKLNGVGPKVALALLSGLTPAAFLEVIRTQSVAHLQRIPGIGSKTAQRILVEMQDRLPKLDKVYPKEHFLDKAHHAKQEAIEALMALGYKAQEATKAVNQTKTTDVTVCEEIIKDALQRLSYA